MLKKKTQVFLADDHPIVAVGLECILKNAPNHELIGHAESGPEMFEALNDLNPDLLLLDLNMPGNDFYLNLNRLRQEFPRLKVLIYSSYNSPELIRSLLDAGADGFLLKSACASQILHSIQCVTAGKPFVSAQDQSSQPPSDNGIQPDSLVDDKFRKRLRLSKREQEILVLISRGLTSQGIGNTLFISKYTVETHRKNILRKLELNSSTELVKFAMQQGLVQ